MIGGFLGRLITSKLFFILVVGPIVVYNIYAGLTIGRIGLPGGFSIEFQDQPSRASAANVADIPADERRRREAEMDSKLRAMEERLRAQPRTDTPSATSTVNVSGTWQSQNGVSYTLNQNGNQVIFQEVSSLFGTVAAGHGTISHHDMTISYTTIFFTPGRADLRVSDDGRRITGSFTDTRSGATSTAMMYR